ncbi:MAG: UDP-N-acetylmuramoyl-L-alanyl-D-glutamate--2,6-diaminopimelate ligase [Clostridia bacterium]|nr:UDP-N-acetylmuramoyl-L-alanyl-D-glutamate--2,6-diaminopimelate ligase [Clostridia bacterium]
MLLSDLLFSSGLDYTLYTSGSNILRMSAPAIDVKEIFTDSRKVAAGGLFVAIEGIHQDSHAYIEEACEHGAAAAVVSRAALAEGRVQANCSYVPLVAVDDTRAAFAGLFAAWYGNPQKKLKFVGVTGTCGKTTVCSLISHVMSSAGIKTGILGTVGNVSLGNPLELCAADPLANMTTPDPPALYRALDQMARDGVEYVIMEVSSHALALCKVDPIYFDVAVFTNLGEDHLDFHLNKENYFAAKSLLFARCRDAVINIDDAYGKRLAQDFGSSAMTCSAEGRAARTCAMDVCLSARGSEYKLCSRGLRLRVRTQLIGRANVMNTLEAIAACHLCGISVRDIKDGIASFLGVCGRFERLRLDTDYSVYIDFAHTPDALESLLRTARQIARRGQRIVLVFGCGGDRDRQKRAAMGRVASQMADMVVITSDNSRTEHPMDIISEILMGVEEGATYTVIEDRRAAIEYAIKNARSGDIILLAGKGHEQYEIDRSGRHAFSERDIVCELVRKYRY